MDRFILTPAVVISTGDEGYVAFQTETGQLRRLNATAALILEIPDVRSSISIFPKAFRPMNKAHRDKTTVS